MPLTVAPTVSSDLPVWAPTRERVADYVSPRTVITAAGGNELLRTFTENTQPTGGTVDRLIADGVAWVLAECGAVADTLTDLASTVAALHAAWAVELSWPDREATVKDTSLGVADRLRAQAEAMMARLVAANTAAGQGSVAAGSPVLPRWQFPDPVPHGDWLL